MVDVQQPARMPRAGWPAQTRCVTAHRRLVY